ncbi:MAG: hypothetical protein ACTJH9_07660 [Pseudoalteromonas sp.]|uniref:hypothetical protein n=1 Tax=unclassified Pseudoalteromonas TaxID=194690 RepID=UPI003F952BDF
MTKTEKNLDKAIRRVLTLACEKTKDDVPGFVWLTHHVDLQKPNKTLKVSCYFANESTLNDAKQNNQLINIEQIINTELGSINLSFQAIAFLVE